MPGPVSAPNGDARLTHNVRVTVCNTHGRELKKCEEDCTHRSVQERLRLLQSNRLTTGKTAARRSRAQR